MAVTSPCINVCRMNPATGLCEGCLRTLDEIRAWGASDDDGRLRILAAVSARRADTGGTQAATAEARA
ncbi:MAG: DUF1289 domain-containing protein [Rhodocyclaceae bacterium]